MNKPMIGVLGLLAGAAATYWWDPRSGRRRRARLSDRLTHVTRQLDHAAGSAARDVQHRSRGAWHRLLARLSTEVADDSLIVERIHSQLGHVCSHPGAIEVRSREGRVLLSGSILRSELEPTLDRLSRIRGVQELDGDLKVYDEPAGVPELQGGSVRQGGRFMLRRTTWPPAAQLLVAGTGAGLLAYGAQRRGVAGLGAGLLGLGLIVRGVSRRSLRQLLEVQPLELAETFQVDLPPGEVHEFWRSPENLPRFMRRVRSVQQLSEGVFRWEVEGPAGTTLTWDCAITEDRPGEQLSWETLGHSGLQHRGSVHLEPDGQGGTRVRVRMIYQPPRGRAGRELARFLTDSARQQLAEDLQRFKSLIEEGRGTAHRVTAALQSTGGRS